MRRLWMFVILLLVVGCVSIPQPMKDGSKLLVKSYDSLQEDYTSLKSKVDLLAGFVKGLPATEQTDKMLKEYQDIQSIFKAGFDAVGIAVRAMNDAIQALE